MQELIEEVRTWAREVEQLGQPRFGELGARVELIRQTLAERSPRAEEAPTARDDDAQPAEPSACRLQLQELRQRLEANPAEFSSWSGAVSTLEKILDPIDRKTTNGRNPEER
ncbi:MAG: hypothetical protein DWQ34_04805 [Planctomycetota bacterium]|nr:MAG: hypothetical protein DWQ29_04105 [Planctomycetota bacterium]REJ96048.1 MAG: hypothetical protein DWQ34_04805 [Planctomycetota bacterium]REK27181.1 MAG: hypothetical protein DWQ41_07310 [Planctomycetota bacterium]REK36798.1 MAG: hypothetical protein DWQ45_09325 [Planctomycetota bacterium]